MNDDNQSEAALSKLSNSLKHLPLSVRWKLKRTQQTKRARRRIQNFRFGQTCDLFSGFEGIRAKTDTLFILGSGPTINNISSAQWALISRKDSWGFNYSFLHPHVPDVLFLQYAPVTSPKSGSPLEKLFPFFFEKYKKTTLIFKGGVLDSTKNFNGKLFDWLRKSGYSGIGLLPVFMPTPVLHRLGTSATCDWLVQSGFLSYGQGWNLPAIQVRSTLGLMLTLAVYHGYKDVVLCGFDGESMEHFFDNIRYPYELKEGVDALLGEQARVQNEVGGHPHSTVLQYGKTTNDIVVEYMMFLTERFKMNFYRGSQSASFAHILPEYW